MTPAFGMFDAYKFGFRALGRNFLLILGIGAVLGFAVIALILAINAWVVPLEWVGSRTLETTSTSFNFEFSYMLLPKMPIVITPLQGILIFLGMLTITLMGVISKMFFARIGLDTYEYGKSSFEQLKKVLPMLGTYLLTVVLIYFIIVFGLVLLVVPGFIFWMKYGFGDLIVLDTHLGPIEAIQRSGKITYGYKWRLFGFYALSFLFGALSSIVILVGPAIWAFVFIFARTYVYRKLVERYDNNQEQFTAVPPRAA